LISPDLSISSRCTIDTRVYRRRIRVSVTPNVTYVIPRVSASCQGRRADHCSPCWW